jgi:NTE family protein
VPIDHFSYEAVELLKDTAARWRTMSALKRAASPALLNDPKIRQALSVPQAEVYAIDVSFDQLEDKAEVAFLNRLPTSFVLTDEAVDRLRAAAGKIIAEAPEFQRLLKDIGSRVLQPAAPPLAANPK